MIKVISTFLLCCLTTLVLAQECPILPTPAVYQRSNGQFVCGQNLVVDPSNIPPNLMASFKDLASWSLDLQVSPMVQNPMVLFKKLENVKQDSYSITIDHRITIAYSSDASCFYALVSLMQLGKKEGNQVAFQQCFVKDFPTFQWRGLHLDVSRHFFTPNEVKRYIDLMAYYKFNTLHWHLTDDQGWRIEIKKYPLLTAVGAYRDSTVNQHYTTQPRTYTHQRYGGFYTQEEVKDIVAYAEARFITVVPEIEMPGHARAALAAYPNLSCTGTAQGVEGLWGIFDDIFCAKEESILFLQDVLTEVLDLFPSTYIHVGGDEAPKTRWNNCPNCHAVMEAHHLHDSHELQSYFIGRMDSFLTAHGRKLIGWDEILEGGLSPNATVMSWRGTAGGIAAAAQGHNVVMCPGSHCYFDHYQGRGADEPLAIGGYTPLFLVFNYQVIPSEMTIAQAAYVLGAQANLWTEYIPDMAELEYMAYPRAIALSCALWSSNRGNYEQFMTTLTTVHFPFLTTKKVNYSKSCLKPELLTLVAPYGIQLEQIPAPGIKADTLVIASVHASKHKNSIETIRVQQGNNLPDRTIQILTHKALGAKVVFQTPPSPKYNNGGVTIVDGQLGARPWKGNEWLGFDTNVVSFDLILPKATRVRELKIHTLHDPNSWIWAVQTYTIEISKTGTGNGIVDGYSTNETIVVSDLNEKTKAIHIELHGLSRIPSGEAGAGNTPWLFIDEIEVR